MEKIKTDNGKNGGELKGVYHDSPSGGIPATIEDSGRGILVESDEVIINRRSAQCTECKHEFDGKKMTNKQILSEINQEKGGVPIMENGGSVMEDGGTISDIEQKIKAFETLLKITKDVEKRQLIEKKISAFKILSKLGKEQKKEPDMSEFIKIIQKSKSFEDAYDKVAAIKDVSSDKSDYFAAKYNPDRNRTSKEAFLVMYDEYKVVPEGEKEEEESIQKEAWEMRRADWYEVKIKEYELENADKFLKKYGASWVNEKSVLNKKKKIIHEQFDFHKKSVQEAISQGKNVPYEVLADYPELKKEEKTENENPAIEEYIDGLMKYDIEYVNQYIRPQLGQESHNAGIDGVVTEEKIQEYLNKIRENRRVQAENFVKLVYEKENYERLLDILTNKDNKASRKLFTKLTGISLGSTIADSKNAVNSYFGSDVVAESKKKAEQAEKERKESYRQRQIDSELSQKVRVGGEIITYKEHYDKAMQNGYNVIEMTERGNFPIMHLKNKDTSSFWIIKKKIHMDYIREKLGKND